MVTRSRSMLRRVRFRRWPEKGVPSSGVLGRAAATAALAVLVGCGSPEGTFQPGPAAPPDGGSVQDAQQFCDPEHPEYARVDVLSTVELHEVTDPKRHDAVGTPAVAVLAVAGQFCGSTEFRGEIAAASRSDVPDGAGFLIRVGTQDPGPGAEGFKQLFVPASATELVRYRVSTEDDLHPGVRQGAGLRLLKIDAVWKDGLGTLDNDSHDTIDNPRRNVGPQQNPVRQGPLTVRQMRDLAVSTATERARQLGIRR